MQEAESQTRALFRWWERTGKAAPLESCLLYTSFRINDNAVPEIVDGYVFQQPKQDRNFPLTELTEQQHREALENGFGQSVVIDTECERVKLPVTYVHRLYLAYVAVASPRGDPERQNYKCGCESQISGCRIRSCDCRIKVR